MAVIRRLRGILRKGKGIPTHVRVANTRREGSMCSVREQSRDGRRDRRWKKGEQCSGARLSLSTVVATTAGNSGLVQAQWQRQGVACMKVGAGTV